MKRKAESDELQGPRDYTKTPRTASVAVIVPFRDLHSEQNRTQHLNHFTQYMQEQFGNHVRLFVIEQSEDNRLFNRGMLLNIGFEIAKNQGCQSFIFHDVDLLPVGDELREHYEHPPRKGHAVHIAACWTDRYQGDKYFGGIVAFTSEDFEQINGFPNNYWGWGGEDDELRDRVKKCSIRIDKVRQGTIQDLEELKIDEKLSYLKTKKLKNMQKWELRDQHRETWRRNGLCSLDYKILESEGDSGSFFSRFVVNLISHEPEDFKYEKKLPHFNKDCSIWQRTDIQPNQVLRDMFKEGFVQGGSGNILKFHSGITPKEGFHLYDLIVKNEFKNILEVGMAFGTSALYMCQALCDSSGSGKLCSVDPFQSTQWGSIGIFNVKRANLSQFHELREQTSYIAMPEILKEIEEGEREHFDLVFVDGMHLFDFTLVDVFYAVKMLRLGGCLVIDDIRHSGVKAVLNYLRKNYCDILLLQESTPCSDTACTFIKAAHDKRRWNFHKRF